MRQRLFSRLAAFEGWGTFPHWAIALFTLGLMWTIFISSMSNSYHTDSYFYYLLGKSLFVRGTYQVSVIRDYYNPLPDVPLISRDYPPLLPFLSGLVDSFLGLRVVSSSLVNFGVLAGMIFLSLNLGEILKPGKGLYFLIGFALFFVIDSEYRTELICGRTIGLGMLLVQGALFFFLKQSEENRPRLKFLVPMGILLALALLNRFDQMLFAFACPVGAFFLWRKPLGTKSAMISAAIVLATTILFYSPWGLRNIHYFHSPFANNGNFPVQMAKPVGDGLVWFSPGEQPPNLHTHFLMWLKFRIFSFMRNTYFLEAVTGPLFFPLGMMVVLWKRITQAQRTYLFLCLLYSICLFGPVTITNFAAARYYSPMFYCLMNLTVILLLQIPNFSITNPAFRVGTVILVLFFTFSWWQKSNFRLAGALIAQGRFLPPESVSNLLWYHELATKLGAGRKTPPLIADWTDADALTYATGLTSTYVPRNLEKGTDRLKTWIAKWNPDYLVVPTGAAKLWGVESSVIGTAAARGMELIDVRSLKRDL